MGHVRLLGHAKGLASCGLCCLQMWLICAQDVDALMELVTSCNVEEVDTQLLDSVADNGTCWCIDIINCCIQSLVMGVAVPYTCFFLSTDALYL